MLDVVVHMLDVVVHMLDIVVHMLDCFLLHVTVPSHSLTSPSLLPALTMVDPEIAAMGVLEEQPSVPRAPHFGRSHSALSGHSPCEGWGGVGWGGVGWGGLLCDQVDEVVFYYELCCQ